MKKNIRWFNRITQYFFVALVTLLVMACSSKPKPEPVDKLSVELTTAKNINPNDKGVANPLRITVYTLKNTDEFKSSDFFTITEEGTPSLKEQMEKVFDGIMLPNETKTIELTLNSGITAIGVVAAYREIEQAEWNAVFSPLPKKRVQPWYKKWWSGKQNDPVVKVRVERLSISIKEMD
ncbi:type VI secretion system lipoprotein TssJ [Yersinia enterocolitica]|uniref:type VI secretion system lipoprotein TssJ n=1 Tax=Yersinia enterocolitica TaxID=630 RepID=UPI000D84D75B|nr:type VI secretion system lipoprotein TssJ [Yersinia enterocolitica]SQA41230.1 type VI secretion lipoprotein/VasD [Yersinia enterocolitica]SUP66534.1 type VI secretion lipoprotein/VasD [Yersinia enterocolitica]HDM8273764.1 type VI secretion system lipoprotein TssJ [Yersinia enterocolitica]HED5566456.1 type VI secretion system lipoprotein TssJ [Yersinia enterocolitica]